MSQQSPGSPAAKMNGCKCDARVNRNGEGAGTSNNGETIYVPNKRCPLHGDEKPRNP